jgi:hypothetical protein
MAMPDRRVIPGTLRIAPNGTLNADITMLDGNGRWIEKKSIEHTFFPQDWTVRDVIEVGDRLSRETPKRGKVKITYKGVKVVGLVNKGHLSTFFPGG